MEPGPAGRVLTSVPASSSGASTGTTATQSCQWCGWTVPPDEPAAFQLVIFGGDRGDLGCKVCYLSRAIARLLLTEGSTPSDRRAAEEILHALYHTLYDEQRARRRAALESGTT